MAGLGVASIFLIICFGIYKRLKKSSLNENHSQTIQKNIILLRIGLFWGFWWIVGGLLILFLSVQYDLNTVRDLTFYILIPSGLIFIPSYVFYCGYQLFYKKSYLEILNNKKNINAFNKKEENKENICVAIFSFVIVIIIIGIVFSYYTKKGTKVEFEIFPYKENPKLTIDDFKYPYEDEKTWIKEGFSCQSLGNDKKIEYCLEIKKTCSEFIPEKNTNMRPFSNCVSKSREMFGIPPSKKLDIFGNIITNTKDIKVNLNTLYGVPFNNFESLKERWVTMSSETKLKALSNIFETGTTYDMFPDWLKNDPAAIEMKEELQKTDINE